MSAHDDVAALLAWCQETALDTGLHVVELDYWGYCATNARTETTWFAWFPTRKAMLTYFGSCWPMDYYVPTEAAEQDAATPLRIARYGEYARQFAAGECDLSTFLARLSSAYPDVTVHWLGTLDELANGDTPFARAWRSEFRMTGGSDDVSPLRDDEWDDALLCLSRD